MYTYSYSFNTELQKKLFYQLSILWHSSITSAFTVETNLGLSRSLTPVSVSRSASGWHWMMLYFPCTISSKVASVRQCNVVSASWLGFPWMSSLQALIPIQKKRRHIILYHYGPVRWLTSDFKGSTWSKQHIKTNNCPPGSLSIFSVSL